MASDVPVVRTGYRPTPPNQNSSETQGLMQFQDTLEKILKMVCDVKSKLGHVRKSTCPEPTKNVDASVQRRKQFGPRKNDKSDKPRKFANVAIQKLQFRKSHPVPLVGRIVSITESESESEEVAQVAGIVEDTHLNNYRILTTKNPYWVAHSLDSSGWSLEK